MSESEYYLGFSVFSGIGPVKFKKLTNTFESAKRAWEASTLQLSPVIGEVTTAHFDEFRKNFSIEDYNQQLRRKEVEYVSLLDKEYPKLLKQTSKAPIGLFVKGDVSILCHPELDSGSPAGRQASSAHREIADPVRTGSGQAVRNDTEKTIAVVGTRRTTHYGREVTELLTRELVAGGFTVVSGLAMGVDAVAHKTTLAAEGKTIAVLGCGVDCCTPRENLALYNSIIQQGGIVVSELPLGHPPTIGSFPARNRIIAGLSVATLVTEGAEDSGALITADYAFQYDRKVFAVPGQITSTMAKGPLKLLQKGAKLVTNAQDILSHLNVRSNKNGLLSKSIKFESKEEETIGNLLSAESLTFDEIVHKTNIDSAQLGTLLSMMEIKGLVKNDGRGKYIIVS